jgi:hypothetical protein
MSQNCDQNVVFFNCFSFQKYKMKNEHLKILLEDREEAIRELIDETKNALEYVK